MSGDSKKTVLVIGSGGREHALAERLLRSASVKEVVVCPGYAGTQAPGLSRRDEDPEMVAERLKPDLVVIGPELPLCEGMADRLCSKGLIVFGPSERAAELEGSKRFMKEFAVRHGIRTARHVTVTELSALDAALASFPSPPVVKAVGLCAGKGVVVATSFAEARDEAARMLSGEAFGTAGSEVVIEENIQGQEVSVHAICDGERFVVLPAIQDHKRIGEGDTGPNTGGMGTYGPAPVMTPELLRCVESEVIGKVVSGMRDEGVPFRGVLFAGLMITKQAEPILLEINVRFGDPETQVLTNLLEGDFYELLSSAARGQLNPDAVKATGQHGLCVVLASAGYPVSSRKGDVIRGLPAAQQLAQVYHAGTATYDGGVITDGGRVLGVTATASSLAAACDRAYAACDRIVFDGMQLRRDIGHRALKL